MKYGLGRVEYDRAYSLCGPADTLRSVDKKPDPRLAVLTGEAIKLMVEAGATAEVVGHFAVHYPAVVAAKLEPLPLPPPPQELDLEALIRATIQTMFGSGLAGRISGVQSHAVADERARGERGVPRVKKNVIVGGKRTTIKIRSAVYAQMLELQPPEAADKLIQSFAVAAPAHHPNRSAYVEEQLAQYLVLSQVQQAATSRH